jgi:hypothetical protein
VTKEELPSPAETLVTALENGWTVIGNHKSYGTDSKIILVHKEREILGKIPYNPKKIPEITP